MRQSLKPGGPPRRDTEDENQRLKKAVADLSLDKEMLQDVIRQRIQGLHGSGR
jgi:putative transposase